MSDRTRRRVAVAAALASAVVLGVVGYDVWTDRRAIEKQCEMISAVNENRGDERPVSRGGRTMVVLGDSYAQGVFLEDPRADAWSTRLGEQMHWTTYVNASGGSGITQAGPCGNATFDERLADVVARQPDVLVIQTGINESPDDLPAAADDLLEEAESAGVEKVVIVGPPNMVERPDLQDRVEESGSILRMVAAEAGVQYVSLARLDLPFLDDGAHVTAAGHEAIADAVAQALS